MLGGTLSACLLLGEKVVVPLDDGVSDGLVRGIRPEVKPNAVWHGPSLIAHDAVQLGHSVATARRSMDGPGTLLARTERLLMRLDDGLGDLHELISLAESAAGRP